MAVVSKSILLLATTIATVVEATHDHATFYWAGIDSFLTVF